ncbi:MAG: AEC family transporter [Sulfuricellaceae bacterium]|nr:AEC family transporter [Sulfuricellaceae bacterium]
MSNLILLILCFLFGVILRRTGRLPTETPLVLNRFILNISMPALVLLHVHTMPLGSEIGVVMAAGWLSFLLAAGFFVLLARWLKLTRATTGALILMAGLGNTSFFGFPMIEAYYGQAGLVVGILYDQLGSALVLFTLGMVTAGIYSATDTGWRGIVGRIVLFPPFIALLLALLLRTTEYPVWLGEVLKRLGDTLAPLALVSVGFQLHPGHLAGNARNLAIGLGFKLILAPLIMAILLLELWGMKGLTPQVTIFEAAMPPMIAAGIVATEHHLDPELVNLMVSVGLVLSFFTLTAWWWWMRG